MTVTYTVHGKVISEQEFAQLLREEYADNPPPGLTKREILAMSDEDILDMDYFLHEFD